MFSLLIRVSLCFACADSRAQAWIGHSLDDLIRSWGPPAAAATLSDGSRIAEWNTERTGATFSQDLGNGVIIGHKARYWCWARMEADPRGTITKAKVDGNLGGCNSLFRDKEVPGDS